jgi:hypothetical protein
MMEKKEIGIGSASIVLVFAVLCMTIFAVISLTSSVSGRALAEIEVNLVKSYYQADTLAESILTELFEAEDIPDTINGVEIISGWDMDLGVEILSFSCGISEGKELYVVIANRGTEMDILTWRMRDIGEWEIEDKPLNLLPDDFFDLWMDG